MAERSRSPAMPTAGWASPATSALTTLPRLASVPTPIPIWSGRGLLTAIPIALLRSRKVLVGGAHLTAGASGVSASTNGFAWSAGGGIDLRLTHRLAFRPQFDYIGIRVGSNTLNTARLSASIVFRFGLR